MSRGRLAAGAAIAVLCLALAGGVGAFAAEKYLITNVNQIKPSVVRAILKDAKTIDTGGTRDGVSGVAQKAQTGATGPAGPAGPAGPPGSAGTPGIAGTPGAAGSFSAANVSTVEGPVVVACAASGANGVFCDQQTSTAQCPSGATLISGGFTGEDPGSVDDPAPLTTYVDQDGPAQPSSSSTAWAVTLTNQNSSQAAEFRAFAICATSS